MESGRAIVDPVESFTNVSACLRLFQFLQLDINFTFSDPREAKQGMKKQLRLAMLDRWLKSSYNTSRFIIAMFDLARDYTSLPGQLVDQGARLLPYWLSNSLVGRSRPPG